MTKKEKISLYINGLSIAVILLAIDRVLAIFGITWAIFPYQTVIIIVFSVVYVYTKSILTRKMMLYKRNRFTFLLIGAISSITIISGLRDIMSGHLKIIVNGVLSVEFCMIIICVMFLVMFLAYLYIELLNREISIRYQMKGREEEIDE